MTKDCISKGQNMETQLEKFKEEHKKVMKELSEKELMGSTGTQLDSLKKKLKEIKARAT